MKIIPHSKPLLGKKDIESVICTLKSGQLGYGEQAKLFEREFARFLGIARRSAVEVQSLLYAAMDIDYIDQTEFDLHYEQARKAKALIGGFKRSLTK